jgi:phosphate-selective porin OprO/OprP
MKKIISALALCLFITCNANAQDDEEKLVIKPSGRILMDAGLFDADKLNNQFNDGFAIPDVRVGFKAKYGDWSAKADIGYAYGSVGLKDIFIERSLSSKDIIRGGYFIHQYGLQSATSSSFKVSMEEPRSNQAFNDSRLLGVMYEHSENKFLGTLSFFSETDAMKMTSDKLGNQAVGVMTRLVYRPFTEPGKIFHIGISGAYESPKYNSDSKLTHSSYVLKTTWPTRIDNITSLQATVSNAKALYKFTPEITAATGRLGIESQYFYTKITRDNGFHDYKASGAYCTLRGIIKGDNYKYNYWDGGIDTPSPKSIELILAYDYTDLSDSKADIHGGRSNDWSATLNYYINKYMIWRVRGSYTKTTDRTDYENNHVTMLETRLQIKF